MIIFLLVILVLVLALFTIGYFVFYFAAVRQPKTPEPGASRWVQPFGEEIRSGARWFREQNPERIVLPSRDGISLVGYFLPAEEARGTLLLVHGYRSDPLCDFGVIFRYYHDLGWNILAVCQRSHGESGGAYITFGIKERYDIRDWAVYLSDRLGKDHPIVLDGVSMGSTTVLMSLGTGLPANVRGVIADCGFTCPRDEFIHVLKSRYHLPSQPLLFLTEMHAKALAGFGFSDYSTVTALKDNHLPVLFVHGEKDSFVPPHFTQENYEACAGEKQLVTVPEAGHGTSYLYAGEQCRAILREFLARMAE